MIGPSAAWRRANSQHFPSRPSALRRTMIKSSRLPAAQCIAKDALQAVKCLLVVAEYLEHLYLNAFGFLVHSTGQANVKWSRFRITGSLQSLNT